jgi:predicted ATPase
VEENLTFTNASVRPIKITKNSSVHLNIRPLTVLIGVPGSGKSLVSQLLYFLQDAPYLITNYGKETNPDDNVRAVVNGIRSVW